MYCIFFYKTGRPASADTLPPASLLFLKIPQPSQTQVPARDMSLRGTFSIQALIHGMIPTIDNRVLEHS